MWKTEVAQLHLIISDRATGGRVLAWTSSAFGTVFARPTGSSHWLVRLHRYG